MAVTVSLFPNSVRTGKRFLPYVSHLNRERLPAALGLCEGNAKIIIGHSMSRTKVSLGRYGEEIAAQALIRNGLTLIARNWRCTYGEVDLIARSGGDLYFIEVRTRRGSTGPTPEQSLTWRKRLHMGNVARAYLGEHIDDAVHTWHLSFVAITVDAYNQPGRITFYRDLDGPPEELVLRTGDSQMMPPGITS